MAERVIVLVHGIHTSQKRAKTWMQALDNYLDSRHSGNLDVRKFMYGWISGFSIRFPFVGYWTRHHYVRKFQKFIEKIVKEKGNDVIIDVVCHSFGTYITHFSMTFDSSRRAKAFFNRIVYMGGIVSARENFKNEEGHFKQALNLWSGGDDVIRIAPFGHSGYRGFNNADGEVVINKDMTPFNHNDYTMYGNAWPLIYEFLSQA